MKKYILLTGCLAGIVLLSNLFCRNQSPMPRDKVALGRLLFFEPLLSSTRTISCASCHKPAFAFADTSRVSLGVFNRLGTRNTPSAMNLGMAAFFFWDGRAATLEEQALVPISNPVEMNLPVDSVVARLQENRFYQQAFMQVFGQKPSAKNMATALAAFQRSLETNDAPFDDWKMNDNAAAVSAAAKRGFALFNGRAKCVKCHFGGDFSNTEYRNIGLYNGTSLTDSGRGGITHLPQDIGMFKIGPLRNIALTAPYMHNGMFRTLREVIDYYNDPDRVVPNSFNRDTLLSHPLNLSTRDKEDLEAFLLSLTSKSLQK